MPKASRKSIPTFHLWLFVLAAVMITGSVTALSLMVKQQGGLKVATASAATPLVPNGTVGQTANWNLIFNDEFDVAPLNTTKWANCIYWGITKTGCWENTAQLEWYLPKNAVIANGLLDIQTKKEQIKTTKGTFNYTSGLITSDRDTNTTSVPSKFSFTYGFAEIRAKLPKGKGIWPAFWMLPSDHTDSSEIDIMEVLGDQPATTYMTYHWGNQLKDGSHYVLPNTDFSADFHTFAVDWQPQSITWYVDGVAQKTFTNAGAIINKPMYLIANTQVGGTWAGNPDSTTVFPADYLIDYIRVWQKGTGPTPTALPTITPTRVPTAVPSPTLVPTAIPTATPTAGSVSNLLSNPSFESGTAPWSLDVKTDAAATLTQAATATSGSYSGLVTTTLASPIDWHVQLAQNNLALAQNGSYKITFSAKADTARTIPVVIQLNNSPYTELFRTNVTLGTGWQTYQLNFTSSQTTADAKLTFSLGDKVGKVWIDGVSVNK